MAPRAAKAAVNSRGGALAEALPVSALLLFFVSGILLGGYLIFARAWLEYQSEQSLYCLAENHSPATCRERLKEKLRTGLPFGSPGNLNLSNINGTWKVSTEWKIQGYRLPIAKQLDARRIVRSKGLRW